MRHDADLFAAREDARPPLDIAACRKKRQSATDSRIGSPQGLKLLGADLQSFVILGADWHARCLKSDRTTTKL
jgi:hypothetical protein